MTQHTDTIDRNDPANWEPLGVYYAPIAFYDGKVLKCYGLACKVNVGFMLKRPGMQRLPYYIADRITADTHQPYTDTF